jgi:antitoxin ParD1/3/4
MDANSPELSLSLPPDLREFVHDRVASGDYPSAAEYVSQLIQADQKQRAVAELHRLLKEGLESGPSVEATDEFWDTLEREVLDGNQP